MKNKNTYNIIGSLIIAIGLVGFGFYTTKCYGDECDLKRTEIIEKKETKEEKIIFNMDPNIITKQVINNEIILIDVREDSEWDEGHIKDAIHIPLGDLNIKTTNNIPKDKPLYVYCRSGRRAGEAVIKLKSLGFDSVRNIGGIIEWQGKGGTLVSI